VELVGADESIASSDEGISGSLAIGSTLQMTANLNLRSGPSTGYKVLRVMSSGAKAVTVEVTAPSGSYYKINHNGTVGWAHGGYMKVVSTPSGGGSSGGLSGSVPIGTTVESTGDVNFRSGPSTSESVLDVLASGTQATTVETTTPQNGYYKLNYKGSLGWSHGDYLKIVDDGGSTPPEPVTPPPSSSDRDGAIARAKAAMGFSYWWGHGRWLAGGPSSSNKGSCSGSCPSCSHSGSYGADCSGLVAKVWQVPSSNSDITVDGHPYSTADFIDATSQWKIVSRGSLAKADALVYRSSSSGHIFLYESGDGWGSMWAYECKGCSAGCVKNLRTAGSSYKGIRRSGY
jgi:uncharacterized protein YraI